MVNPAAFRPRIQNSRRGQEDKRCEPFLKWLRGRPCHLSVIAVGDHLCAGKVRACHFDPWGDKGMGTKVSDNACMPMCDGAHGQQHMLGWREFQTLYGFDGRHVVTAYWLHWLNGTPMGTAWQADQEAQRGPERPSPLVRIGKGC